MQAPGPTIGANVARVRERIAEAAQRAGRKPESVKLVAVSKTVPPERIREAFAAGLRAFGENRAQELRAKLEPLSDCEIEWHFVGHLQRNKAKYVVPVAALIHSVDSVELGHTIEDRAARLGKVQPVLVQVNTTGEETKSGIEPADLPRLLDALCTLEHVRVEGLMTIGPLTTDRKEIRSSFKLLARLLEEERRQGRPHCELHELSMGMSGDFEIAIEEGATIVRIGTAIFGPR